jgi:hypothetical protein
MPCWTSVCLCFSCAGSGTLSASPGGSRAGCQQQDVISVTNQEGMGNSEAGMLAVPGKAHVLVCHMHSQMSPLFILTR